MFEDFIDLEERISERREWRFFLLGRVLVVYFNKLEGFLFFIINI